MHIEDNNYKIYYLIGENKFIFEGNLRLQSLEKYNEILQYVMDNALISDLPVVLDLSKLMLLNSSGIAALSLLMIKIRDKGKQVKIISSKYVYWQSLSIEDFKELNPELEINYVVHH